MEKNTPPEKFMEELTREMIEAEPRFFELIDFTREIMLRDPTLHLPGHTEDRPEQPSTPYSPAHPTQRPERTVTFETNPKLLREIEALGKAILEEAFMCLGKDAPEKAALLQQADETTALSVLDWLFERIQNIRDNATYKYKEDSTDYSPLRISPKVIGEHPEARIEPTCLGYAILISSFFHKAGLPTLQASVVRSYRENLIEVQEDIAQKLMDNQAPGRTETILPLKPLRNIKLSRLRYTQHIGFHAATYTKIPSLGNWLQADFNYKQNTVTSDSMSVDLDESYAELEHARKLGDLGRSVNAENYMLADRLLAVAKTYTPLSAEALEKAILNGPIEETYSRIIQHVFEPFWGEEQMDTPIELTRIPSRQDLIRHVLTELNIDSHKLQELVSDVLENFVFTDPSVEFPRISTIEEVSTFLEGIIANKELHKETKEEKRSLKTRDISHLIARLHADPHYRNDRIQDLLAAPYALLLKIGSILNDTTLDHPNPHRDVCIGSLCYTVGITALSDTAVYYGDKLPLSTWLSYWENVASLIDHRHQITSPLQKELARSAFSAIWLEKDLTYPSIASIIFESMQTLFEGEYDDKIRRQGS